jgi:hypothetical protein
LLKPKSGRILVDKINLGNKYLYLAFICIFDCIC